MIKFDDVTKENIKEYDPNWLQIGGSGSGKTNSLFNLINQQSDIDNFFYMLKIHIKQTINFLLTNETIQALSISVILKLLLNTQMI